MPTFFPVPTDEWKRLVDDGVAASPRSLRREGRTAVMLIGFYPTHMSATVGDQLAGPFAASGRYVAFLVGTGAWGRRKVPEGEWQQLYRQPGACLP